MGHARGVAPVKPSHRYSSTIQSHVPAAVIQHVVAHIGAHNTMATSCARYNGGQPRARTQLQQVAVSQRGGIGDEKVTQQQRTTPHLQSACVECPCLQPNRLKRSPHRVVEVYIQQCLTPSQDQVS